MAKKKQKASKRSKLLNSGGDMVINKIQQQNDEAVGLKRQVIELKQQIRMLYLCLFLCVLLIITLLYMFFTCIMQQAKCYENIGEFIKGDYLQSLLGNIHFASDISAKIFEMYN